MKLSALECRRKDIGSALGQNGFMSTETGTPETAASDSSKQPLSTTQVAVNEQPIAEDIAATQGTVADFPLPLGRGRSDERDFADVMTGANEDVTSSSYSGQETHRDRGEVIGSAGRWLAGWALRFIVVAAAAWVIWKGGALIWSAVLPVILALIVCTILAGDRSPAELEVPTRTGGAHHDPRILPDSWRHHWGDRSQRRAPVARSGGSGNAGCPDDPRLARGASLQYPKRTAQPLY